MKVECVKKKITDLIKKAERVAGKNTNLPILNCLLLKAGKGTLSVGATNLDLGVMGELAVRVFKEGELAVPAAVLFGFLSQLGDDGNVVFESVGGNLTISTKHTNTTIKVFPVDEFPTIPMPIKESVVTILGHDIIKGFQSVWYSSAVSSMKPELSSVYVHPEDSAIVFTATDSFRLAEKKIHVKNLPNFHPILIPFKNIPDIIRIFEDYKGDLELCINKSQVSLSGSDSLYVVSRVVEGTFPDYKQIIPKECTTEAVVLREDLVSALKISSIFSDTFKQVSFTITPGKKLFEMSAENSHVGKNTTTLDAVVKGDEIKVNFNHRYILDCFQSISADSISLMFNGPHKPVVLRGVNDRSFTYLVMPMNK